MEIKELLAEGTTEEELVTQLKKQIAEAKEELKKEEEAAAAAKEKEARLKESRDRSRGDLVYALINYMETLNLLDELSDEDYDNLFDKISQEIKKCETSIHKMTDVFQKLETNLDTKGKKVNSEYKKLYDWWL